MPSKEEMLELLKEAQHLAEAANDANERWRLRTVAAYWPIWSAELATEAETRLQMAVSLEAADFFTERADWEAWSEALDYYSALAHNLGDFATSIAATRRRLAAPALSALERADALGALVDGLWHSGDLASVLETVRSEIMRRRPGEPATMLSRILGSACFAAYYSGRWSEIADFIAVLDEASEQAAIWPGIGPLFRGYVAQLHVAMAQQNRPLAERAAAAARRLIKPVYSRATRVSSTALIDSCVADDPVPLQAAIGSVESVVRIHLHFAIVIMFLSERAATMPRAQINLLAGQSPAKDSVTLHLSAQIADALTTGDNTRLATAIDNAEAHGLIPHAARMRIVLAQRTGDRAPLERARPVLERLGDRQFLRRLDEVAASLPQAALNTRGERSIRTTRRN